ncbi:MAG: hypothetical protein V5A63_18890 [Bacteroides sp.]|uniref:hypothetical protein n=1 Tax=Bacteroides sp. TaxID=29523 RepID=UPI002FC32D7C
MRKIDVILLSFLLLLSIAVPVVSASYYRKATYEFLEDSWDGWAENDTTYNTVANSEYCVMKFEDDGWWLLGKGMTFFIQGDKLKYRTGWWIWEESGTVEPVKEENSTFIYNKTYEWEAKVFDKHVRFFYLEYNDSWNGTLTYNTTNVTINYYHFGQKSGKVAGCFYESEGRKMLSVKEIGYLESLKYLDWIKEDSNNE